LNPLDRYERFPSCYISSPFPEFILTLDSFEHGGRTRLHSIGKLECQKPAVLSVAFQVVRF
jgi:hypothetical protein